MLELPLLEPLPVLPLPMLELPLPVLLPLPMLLPDEPLP